MPDEPAKTPDKAPPEPPADAGDSVPTPDKSSGIKPGMNEAQIRDAGLAIDVPFETTGEPDRLRYADLGKGKKWQAPADWPPDQGQPQERPEDAQ